ncbi:lecithin-cholesterol acyltransferase-like 4 [Aristolochia californica]|uniref:lecithin-cholesterol acyltransferase-like 4 n=1 Tax=Aristolochia californica TaxID=171875 RepID=UPI0035DAE1C0
MAVLEEVIQLVNEWLRSGNTQKPYVNPNLDPVLLVPGIAGSILNAVTEDGREERVWVRVLGADHEFQKKLWSRFDPSTGKTVSLDSKTSISVPEDRYGLFAIDNLDPDMIVGRDSVFYFHDMIEQMIKWGFQEGKTLFGFGYDFRQSNRFQETMDRFSAKLESVYTSSGCKKINIITHSMGGLLVKCFMALHTNVFEKYVKSWIAIAAPFQGAPGYITTSLLNGMSFVDGWEQNFFVSKWSMHQLLIECPSIYELMGCPDYDWHTVPLLQLWRERHDSCGNASTILESYAPSESISLMAEALSNNKVNYDGVELSSPLNLEILKWARETQKILSTAEVPSSVKFYNIYGSDNGTAHSVCYGSEQTPISDLQQILLFQARYICVDGDGTVPAESAKADGLNAEARVGVPGDHRGIICDLHVFRILKHWLKVDSDPFYNPLNDFVILPTAFEFEKHKEDGYEIRAVKEEWEIISRNEEESALLDQKTLIGSVSVSHTGKDPAQEEAQATVIVHPHIDGMQHIEVVGFSVAING